mmetsp:Transcript_18007/g.25151  ORF Transcript_18007/g.25151 Transcript_18007/m.25151 type:complete len:643 (+) Transcript_18007:241-2169(+)
MATEEFKIGSEFMGERLPLTLLLVKKDHSPYLDYERIQTLGPRLKEIQHPNLLRYLQVVVQENQTVMVMEKVQGESLREFLLNKSQRRLSEEESKVIFKQLLAGVECLHQFGVVHRNLNLETVYLNEKGELKLGDYLLASRLSILRPTSTKSSFHFFAPEIWLDDEGKLSTAPAVDVWSLGVILYVMACGCYPFLGKDECEIFLSVKRGQFGIPSFLSNECASLIRAILQPNPSQRPTVSFIKEHSWLQSSMPPPPYNHRNSRRNSLVGIPLTPRATSPTPYLTPMESGSAEVSVTESQDGLSANDEGKSMEERIKEERRNSDTMTPPPSEIIAPGSPNSVPTFPNAEIVKQRKRSWSGDFMVENVIENFLKQKATDANPTVNSVVPPSSEAAPMTPMDQHPDMDFKRRRSFDCRHHGEHDCVLRCNHNVVNNGKLGANPQELSKILEKYNNPALKTLIQGPPNPTNPLQTVQTSVQVPPPPRRKPKGQGKKKAEKQKNAPQTDASTYNIRQLNEMLSAQQAQMMNPPSPTQLLNVPDIHTVTSMELIPQLLHTLQHTQGTKAPLVSPTSPTQQPYHTFATDFDLNPLYHHAMPQGQGLHADPTLLHQQLNLTDFMHNDKLLEELQDFENLGPLMDMNHHLQ